MNPFSFDAIYKIGVMPVLEIERVDRAIPLAEALLSGGLPLAEITLRTSAALDSIKSISRGMPDVLVGAGTVINRQQAEAARDAGAKFLVCPGLDEETVLWAQEQKVPILAGAVTPTEIMRAINMGLTLLKFFPAEAMGGLKTIKAVSDPFPQVKFIPTGGIGQANLVEYLRSEKIHAVGGSWMARRQAITEGQFNEIVNQTRAAKELIDQIRG